MAHPTEIDLTVYPDECDAFGHLNQASILSLFDKNLLPAEAPPSVTWWDFAFLRALYEIRMTKAAIFQRSEIQSRMAKYLAKVPPEEL